MLSKIVSLVASTLEQISHDGFRRLPIVVTAIEAPAIVHRHASFPGSGRGLDMLFGSGEIFRNAGAVVDQDVGLQLAHHFVHLFRFPAFRSQRPIHVVPKHIHLAVVAAQLMHLPVNVIHKTAPCFLVGLAARSIGMMPIHQRIIEAMT